LWRGGGVSNGRGRRRGRARRRSRCCRRNAAELKPSKPRTGRHTSSPGRQAREEALNTPTEPVPQARNGRNSSRQRLKRLRLARSRIRNLEGQYQNIANCGIVGQAVKWCFAYRVGELVLDALWGAAAGRGVQSRAKGWLGLYPLSRDTVLQHLTFLSSRNARPLYLAGRLPRPRW